MKSRQIYADHRPMRLLVTALLTALVGCSGSSSTSGPPRHAQSGLFTRIQLSPAYGAEGACIGDFNRDSILDIASGPHWYEGPDFTNAHEIYPPQTFSLFAYADVFLTFSDDVNGDGWDDVITIGFPGQAAHWLQNNQGATGPWTQHLLWPNVETESPRFLDLDGDNQRELLCSSGGQMVYLQRDPMNPTQAWTLRRISPMRLFSAFTHGLGAGDLNGDGRKDVITTEGWFEQPASLAGDPTWTYHAFSFQSTGSQIFVTDVDGDGDGDVIMSKNAHGFGLSWFEQIPGQPTGITFVEHIILPATAMPDDPNQFSQLHGLTLADVDGNGLPDIVTGKTYLAHNGSDPEANEPAVLFAFLLDRTNGVRFTPTCIDADSGVGRQVIARDVDNDGRADVVTGNKKGVFLFKNR